jgi:hypothetical protein
MMQPLRKPRAPAHEAIFDRRPSSAARLAVADDSARASPVFPLQRRLDAYWNHPAVDDGARWAPAATVLLAAGVSAAVWAVIAGLALGLL